MTALLSRVSALAPGIECGEISWCQNNIGQLGRGVYVEARQASRPPSPREWEGFQWEGLYGLNPWPWEAQCRIMGKAMCGFKLTP